MAMNIEKLLHREQREYAEGMKRLERMTQSIAHLPGEEEEEEETDENPPTNPVIGLRVLPSGPDYVFDTFRFKGTVSRLLVIGAGPRCDIQLDDPAVSTLHCLVARHGARVYIHDISKTNGLLVNGRRARIRELHPGFTVMIGNTKFAMLTAQRQGDIVISGTTFDELVINAYVAHGSKRAAARALGVAYTTLRGWIRRAERRMKKAAEA